jgi:hypothetical protein
VLELAAEQDRLPARKFAEDELEKLATAELEISTATIKQTLQSLGRELDPPWRADEKLAALTAWLMLRNPR